jgi:hypothetical protein
MQAIARNPSTSLPALALLSQQAIAYTMLGGGSMIFFALLCWLRSPQMLTTDFSRQFCQNLAQTALLFVALLSYPHFIWSYRFAYQQGLAFTIKHFWRLVVVPLLLVAILAVSAVSWERPLTELPLPHQIIEALSAGAIGNPTETGRALFGTLLTVQLVLSGQHFCLQTHGITLALAQEKNYSLTDKQRRLLRWNFYLLWIVNVANGYAFLDQLSLGKSLIHVPLAGKLLLDFLLVASLALVIKDIVIKKLNEEQRLPPALSIVPIAALYCWLQPFLQPYGFQLWAVPIAHGAQFLYCAARAEGNGFSKNTFGNSYIQVAVSAALCAGLGYLLFISLPVFFASSLPLRAQHNFYFIAAYVFFSLHHYNVDGVIWKHGSRARATLTPLA